MQSLRLKICKKKHLKNIKIKWTKLDKHQREEFETFKVYTIFFYNFLLKTNVNLNVIST